MIGWYCPNKFQCNILLNQFELSPLHRRLNIKFDDMDENAREESGGVYVGHDNDSFV
jgi:hypothetical protein